MLSDLLQGKQHEGFLASAYAYASVSLCVCVSLCVLVSKTMATFGRLKAQTRN